MEQQETKIAKKDLIRKKTGYPGMEIHKSGEVEYLTFPALERLNIVTHMVTSRFGGVSTGDCVSFNFSYARDTSREAVDENFRRAAGVFGTTSDAFVCSDQTHTTNIRRVEKEDAVAQVGVIVIYVLSCGIGGFVLGKWKKRQKFLWGLLVGILYVATLLGAALWIQKGSLPPIPYMGTASAICIGSAMLGGMLS